MVFSCAEPLCEYRQVAPELRTPSSALYEVDLFSTRTRGGGTGDSSAGPAARSWTLLRHATKPDAEYLKHVTEYCLRDWYREKGLLPDSLETVIDAASTLDDTIQQILHESGLDQVLPVDR
ncbi:MULTISPECIES: hypothetical protein [Streptomyces]|uniref:Uncharacterized protein n=1 Tax=Streptomyces canarius TaxID=285453 RepID=A0ABQ3DCG3_9ACTN|nr:hypothetical protein [Streptomyces canarius]GHA74437.1 hypothetical protein GCM10010345_91160 [Streptomyces canarius]